MSGNGFGVWCLVLGVCFAVALLLAYPATAGAAELSGEPLFANWLTKQASSFATRSNVIRLCIGVMALALFIMMKKFDGSTGGERPPWRSARR
jgi:hypothetical protein